MQRGRIVPAFARCMYVHRYHDAHRLKGVHNRLKVNSLFNLAMLGMGNIDHYQI